MAERTGVYTARDYVEIMQHLIDLWGVAELRGLTPEVGGGGGDVRSVLGSRVFWGRECFDVACVGTHPCVPTQVNPPMCVYPHPQAEAAQQYLCSLPARLLRLAERAETRAKRGQRVHASFAWVFDRPVALL